MTAGQADIDANPSGTTFCLSGTHNWTLTPKTGDQLIGPAVLDGGNATQYAIQALSPYVVLSNLEIRNYTAATQRGAIHVEGGSPTGWILRDLQVHDNGTVGGGGAGSGVWSGWQILGGRYYNNRQEGLGGGVSGAYDGAVIDGVEIDHNNFTNDAYTTTNIDCGFEGGGMKWVANNVTVENSKIHDNACSGLWSDGSSQGMTITNNQVYNNRGSGIFIEISSGATITGNTVYGNGFSGGSGCVWLWNGGITLASSDHSEVANNTVTANCNGITGTQQNRPDGNPGLLEDDSIHDNAIAGPGGRTGVVADNGADLTTRNITFANNSFSNGTSFCGFAC